MLQILPPIAHNTQQKQDFILIHFFINLLNPSGSRRPGKDRVVGSPTLLCELGNLARDRVGGDSTGTRDHEDRRTVRSINIEWCEVPTFQNFHNVYWEASILNIRTV